MLRGRLLALACISLALTLPSAALADSAGDNQYQDPFAGTPSQPKQQPKQKQQKQTTSGTQQGTQTTPTQAPAATSTPAAPAQNPTAPEPVAHAAGGTLPRTGFPLLPVAAIGAALVAAGLVLRRLA